MPSRSSPCCWRTSTRFHSGPEFIARAALLAASAGLPRHVYERAAGAGVRAMEILPGDPAANAVTAAAWYRLARYQEAFDALHASEPGFDGQWDSRERARLAFLSMTCEALGRHEDAGVALRRLHDCEQRYWRMLPAEVRLNEALVDEARGMVGAATP